jgi:DNA-directed RNA polymerase specialized sigma24 family protein
MPIAPTVASLLPTLRAQAREWTETQDEADDLVAQALELAIRDLPDREVNDVEGWLTQLLTIARDQSAPRHCAVSTAGDVTSAGGFRRKVLQ